MKSLVFILFILGLQFTSQGQTFVRHAGESLDSLVHRTLDRNSVVEGIYEYNVGRSSLLLYFQVRNERELIDKQTNYGETSTLFNALYSTDKVHYTKYLIDTVGNSNSCWAPVRADSILFLNIDDDLAEEMCLILYHIPYCDAYFSYVEVKFFDDYETFSDKKIIHPFKELTFQFFDLPLPDKSKIKERILAELKVKGVLIE